MRINPAATWVHARMLIYAAQVFFFSHSKAASYSTVKTDEKKCLVQLKARLQQLSVENKPSTVGLNNSTKSKIQNRDKMILYHELWISRGGQVILQKDLSSQISKYIFHLLCYAVRHS